MKQSLTSIVPKRNYLVGAVFATALLLCFSLTTLASLNADPVIELNDANQMGIYFETTQPGMSSVEYGLTDEYGQSTGTIVALDARHFHILEGLNVDSVYHYRINLQDWMGGSEVAKEGTFTTPGLKAPEGVRARGGDEQVRISWSHVFGAVEYKVLRSSEAGGAYEVAGTTEDHVFVDTGLENFEEYYYVVHAVTVDGQESAASEEVIGTPSPVHPDLVGNWSFEDDKDSDVVADGSLNGFHGRLMAGAELVEGRGGQVVRLNGGRVEVPSTPEFNFGSEFTVTIWAKLEDTGNNQKLIGRTSIGNGWVLGYQNAVYPELWDTAGVMTQSQGQGTIEANEWTQLALTWKQGEYLIVYINGEEAVRVAATNEPMADNNSILRMGTAPWDTTAFHVQGEIDEVNLYSSALSAEEIRALYEEEADF